MLLIAAGAAYIGVFAAFYAFESPMLGVGAFFYVPVCLAALVTDEFRGALAGVVATGLYVLAIVVMPNLPTSQVLTEMTLIRLFTFVGVGALVGGFARQNRELVGQLRELASKDFLTGIGNARDFDEQLARVGGDEFALLTDLPHDETMLLCTRVARSLDAEELHVSFGATSYPADGTAAVELFRKADDRLFAAKLVSRNRRTVVALVGGRA